jgi:hypothetical protein
VRVPAEILAVAAQLAELRESVVFVGGMVRGLLVTDPAVVGPRPTQDVDVILNVRTPVEFAKLGTTLRRLGFREDQSEDAPICRYVLRNAAGDEFPVDFMPLDSSILGFSNAWYPSAFSTAQRLETSAGSIRVVGAAHFVATKLESFASRGCADYYHHDLEDVVVLVDGRPELVEELAQAADDLKHFVARTVADLLAERSFREALPGHLSPDPASQARLGLVIERLEAIAHLWPAEAEGEREP